MTLYIVSESSINLYEAFLSNFEDCSAAFNKRLEGFLKRLIPRSHCRNPSRHSYSHFGRRTRRSFLAKRVTRKAGATVAPSFQTSSSLPRRRKARSTARGLPLVVPSIFRVFSVTLCSLILISTRAQYTYILF
ncbi:hypothetical protein BJX62DRAFT_156169 [Aspergillus germanicus]